jgi:hypothetical protein
LQIKDSISIEVPRERVFSALTDVEILKTSIPGCENLEALNEMKYSATILSKIGPLKLRFKGQAQLLDIVEPESYTIQGEGSGGPAGRAKVTARVTLQEINNSTILEYDVNAEVGGKLAQLGGSLLSNTAKKLATQFFKNFNESIKNTDTTSSSSTNLPKTPSKISYKILIIIVLLFSGISAVILL